MLAAAKYIRSSLALIYNYKNNLTILVMLVYSILLLINVSVHCYYSIELLPEGDSGKYIFFMDDNNTFNHASGSGSGSGSGPSVNSVTSEENPIIDNIDRFLHNTPYIILQLLAGILRAESVAGYLDDLIGQQLFILICLFFLMVFIILLFVSYIINNIFLHYKDVLLNYFDNKYLRLYFKYQVMLSKLFILYMPIFIIIFMVGLCKGLLFLITHTIPYECLDIDLHTFIKRD